MATTRQSIIRGPGTVTFDGVKFYDADGISAQIDSATQDIPSSIVGKLDTIKTDQVGKITLTPVGNLSEALLGALFPAWIRTPVVGRSIFGDDDKPLVIASKAGTKVTFACAAVTKCPELNLSTVKTSFGQAEFTALLPNGKLSDDADAPLYTVEASPYGDGEPPRTGLSGHRYTATFGQLRIPDTQDGWTVTVEPQIQEVPTDSQGTIDYTLTGVNVTAKCTPLGLTEAQILAALPVLRGRGTPTAGTDDLVIASESGLTVTLKCASLLSGPLNWGATALRAGELGFAAHVDVATGALFDIAYTDPA